MHVDSPHKMRNQEISLKKTFSTPFASTIVRRRKTENCLFRLDEIHPRIRFPTLNWHDSKRRQLFVMVAKTLPSAPLRQTMPKECLQPLEERRLEQSLSLYHSILKEDHILNKLACKQSTTGRLLLPSVTTTRRLNSFTLKAAISYNQQLQR